MRKLESHGGCTFDVIAVILYVSDGGVGLKRTGRHEGGHSTPEPRSGMYRNDYVLPHTCTAKLAVAVSSATARYAARSDWEGVCEKLMRGPR